MKAKENPNTSASARLEVTPRFIPPQSEDLRKELDSMHKHIHDELQSPILSVLILTENKCLAT